ncbi:ABC transporter [Anaerolineae bacterium CFX9]|jgi:ABC-2 type transport system permease protein|nr:ABC transporter [Anaerolineae bacterium CFX9]
MTTITTPLPASAALREKPEGRMPFLLQVSMLTWRTLVTNFRVPAAVLPGLIISVFFLLVYNSTLGNASGFLPGLAGQSYIGFILPLSVVSASLSGAGVAGQSIVRDIERGYFDKLMLTPISRSALLLGPMIAGAILLAIQTILLLGLGFLLGLRPETGLPGVLAVIGLSLLLGVGFAGFTVGIALRTGSAAATGGASFLFFPLSFLTATFVPLELLSGWIKTAATYNPITYILEAMRTLLNSGWDTQIILRGVSASLLLGVILFVWALLSLRARTRRR